MKSFNLQRIETDRIKPHRFISMGFNFKIINYYINNSWWRDYNISNEINEVNSKINDLNSKLKRNYIKNLDQRYYINYNDYLNIIYKITYKKVYFFALSIVKDEDIVNDVVQNVYSKHIPICGIIF